eukprot:CAMPEP_0119017838 /NCGR_PEP_ID=MMETSP1176-20130426/17833_1 /TAXON_ID=265551 /ORGANISM="Synedropsis recta cf, Strain CCMP1620" /LENGTH=122 /DNA_ID=CAMNT_0006971681 /DNA_START=61 /DNA_END=426 /DNA_ORIENTATION=+
MSIFDELCGGWGHMSSLEPASSSRGTETNERNTRTTRSTEKRRCRSDTSDSIEKYGPDQSIDDTDVPHWSSNPSQWEEHKDEMNTMFRVIRSDRLREDEERHRLNDQNREMKERRQDLLTKW